MSSFLLVGQSVPSCGRVYDGLKAGEATDATIEGDHSVSGLQESMAGEDLLPLDLGGDSRPKVGLAV